MLRGLYIAATGMINQSRKLDVISNNLANINTPGFKRDQVITRSFEEELICCLSDKDFAREEVIGTVNHGVDVDEIVVSFGQGPLTETGENTDIALVGEGFFTILTEEGERYTRDGHFTVDSWGRLVTPEGWPVAGEQGPIQVNGRDFQVDSRGNVTVDGVYLDRLRIVNFSNPQALEKEGNNLFVNRDANNTVAPFEGEVRQGFLEGSNVKPADEIINMIVAMRNYESSQRVLKLIDQSLDKAVNEIGRV